MQIQTSSIFIVNDVVEFSNKLCKELPLHSTREIFNEENDSETFLIKNAKDALKEAYISVSDTKYIILRANRFSIDAQNSLLKVLEEPPKNIIFIIVTSSKTSILPTIFSRLSYSYLKVNEKLDDCEIDMKNLNLQTIHSLLKEKNRISKQELKNLIQSMMYAIQKNNISLNQKQLDSFSTSIELCDLNSRPINILTTLLLNLSSNK
jgi:DNA polymerase-3 subunit delta'